MKWKKNEKKPELKKMVFISSNIPLDYNCSHTLYTTKVH